MKVTLNIENDEELRLYIKDCIKGQVMSIVREDFQVMVMDELNRKLKAIPGYQFDQMMKEAMKSAISNILYQQGVTDWRTDYIKPYIEATVDKSMQGTDWKKAVENAVQEKLRSLIK